MNWPTYFFNLIQVIKTKSKDPNTQVGCVIVGKNNQILSTGYNSFPCGINDDVPERRERPEKYLWIEHAERNAIYLAARSGTALEGSTMYMDGIPCVDCARGIIQSGIKKIIYSKEEHAKWNSPKYDKVMLDKSEQMLKEAGVEVISI